MRRQLKLLQPRTSTTVLRCKALQMFLFRIRITEVFAGLSFSYGECSASQPTFVVDLRRARQRPPKTQMSHAARVPPLFNFKLSPTPNYVFCCFCSTQSHCRTIQASSSHSLCYAFPFCSLLLKTHCVPTVPHLMVFVFLVFNFPPNHQRHSASTSGSCGIPFPFLWIST